MHFHPGWEGAVNSGKSDRFAAVGRTVRGREAALPKGMDAQRAALIHDRVRSGYYGSSEAQDALARRLLDSGDL